MKNKKTLAVIAAALLAVSPVAAGAVSLPSATTVKAATQLSSDQLMEPYYASAIKDGQEFDLDTLVKISKTNPVLPVTAGETVRQIRKQRITDVSANVGHLSSLQSLHIYKTFDNGRPDYSTELHSSDKVQQGVNYVAVLNFNYSPAAGDDENYVSVYYGDYGSDPMSLDDNDWGYAALLVPVEVSAPAKSSATAPAKKSNSSQKTAVRKRTSKRAYVKTRKNRRVRTYTSRGRFSKHYVYGHHTYKVTSKKRIKGRGYCWKLSGKNQYVPAKYVKVR